MIEKNKLDSLLSKKRGVTNAAFKLSNTFHLVLFPFIESIIKLNLSTRCYNNDYNHYNHGVVLLKQVEDKIDAASFMRLHKIRKGSNKYKHDIGLDNSQDFSESKSIIKDLIAVNQLINVYFEKEDAISLEFNIEDIKNKMIKHWENLGVIRDSAYKIENNYSTQNNGEPYRCIDTDATVNKTDEVVKLQSKIKDAEAENMHEDKIQDQRTYGEVPTKDDKHKVSKTDLHQKIDNENYHFLFGIQKRPGNSVFKFLEINIPKSKNETIQKNEYSRTFATVFNFIIRNNRIEESQSESFIRKRNISNYNEMYKYAVAILIAIKYHGDNGPFLINPSSGKSVYIQDAVAFIVHYFNLFQILQGDSPLDLENIIKVDYKSEEAINISFDKFDESCISIREYQHERPLNERVNVNEILGEYPFNKVWLDDKINYSIDLSNTVQEKALYDLLIDFSVFQSFKDGQLETVVDILNNNENSICIMPTGSGKSLIYYFVSFLSSKSSIIIEPTDFLLEDQLYHLEHSYKNLLCWVAKNDANNQQLNVGFDKKLILTTVNTYNSYQFTHGIIEHLSNVKHIIIDEIHALSNFSHNYDPNYLTIAFNINTFTNRKVNLLSFTATVDDTIINDLKYQLPIEKTLSYVPYMNKNQLIILEPTVANNHVRRLTSRVRDIILENDRFRVLVFMPAELMDETEAILMEEHKISVFVSGNSVSHGATRIKELNDLMYRVVIADRVFSIGIDIPSVTHVINLYAPLSRIQYVQEMGRSSRDEKRISFNHLFTERYSAISDQDKGVFDEYDYYKLKERVHNCQSEELRFGLELLILPDLQTTIDKVIDLYNQFFSDKQERYIKIKFNDKSKIEIYLYHLYRIGIIFNWYLIEYLDDGVEYFIEINNDRQLSSCVQAVKKYFITMNYFDDIEKLNTIQDFPSLIEQFIKMFYYAYTYHHFEQYRNFLILIDRYYEDSRQLKHEVFSFYRSSVEEVNALANLIESKNYQELILFISSLDDDNYNNLIRINENRHSIKINFATLFFKLIKRQQLDRTLFVRSLNKLIFHKRAMEAVIANIVASDDRLFAIEQLDERLKKLNDTTDEHSDRLEQFAELIECFDIISQLKGSNYYD